MTPEAFIVFFFPYPAEEREWQSGLVGTWYPAKANSPQWGCRFPPFPHLTGSRIVQMVIHILIFPLAGRDRSFWPYASVSVWSHWALGTAFPLWTWHFLALQGNAVGLTWFSQCTWLLAQCVPHRAFYIIIWWTVNSPCTTRSTAGFSHWFIKPSVC